MPGMLPPASSGLSVFTPAFVPAPPEPAVSAKEDEQPSHAPELVEPATSEIVSETVESHEPSTVVEDPVVVDSAATDGWDPEGGAPEPTASENQVQDPEDSAITDPSSAWDPEGGAAEGSGWDPEGGSQQTEDVVATDENQPAFVEPSFDLEGSETPAENQVEETPVSEEFPIAEDPVELPPPGKKKAAKKKKGKKRLPISSIVIDEAHQDDEQPTESHEADFPPAEIPAASEESQSAAIPFDVDTASTATEPDVPALDGWADGEGEDFALIENGADPTGVPQEEQTEVETEFVPEDIAVVEEQPEEVPKTRKKKKRVGDNTEVPDQPHFTESGSSETSSAPKKGKKVKKGKGKKADVSSTQIEVAQPEATEEEDPITAWAEDTPATDAADAATEDSLAADVTESELQMQETAHVVGAIDASEPTPEERVAGERLVEITESQLDEEGTSDQPADAEVSDEFKKGSKKKKKKAGAKKSSAKVEQLQQQLDSLLSENSALKEALSNPETRAELITQDVLSELDHLRQLAAEQQEKIDQLLAQIEDLQQGRSSMSSSGSDSDATDRLSALETQNQDLRRMHDAAINLRDEIAADKKRLQDHVSQLSADLDRLRKEQEASKRETSTLQEQCRELVEKWNSYRETLDSEKKSASADLDAAQRERERLASERAALDQERQQLRRAQEEFEAEKAISKGDLTRERQLFEQSRQQLDRELEVLQVQLEAFEKEKSTDPQFRGFASTDDYADAKPLGVDSTLQSELEDLHSKLAEAERRLSDDSSEEKIAELNRTIQELVASHNKIEESRSVEIADLKHRYDSKMKENATLQGELEELCQRLDLVEKDNSELRDDLQKDRKRAGENLKHWNEKTSLLQQEVDSLAENNKAIVHQKEDLLRQLEELKAAAPNPAPSSPPKKVVKADSFGGWDDFDDFDAPKDEPLEDSGALPADSADVENLKSENSVLQNELKGLYELVQKYEHEMEQLTNKLSLGQEENEALREEALAMRQQLEQVPTQSSGAAEHAEMAESLAATQQKCSDLETALSDLQSQLKAQISANADAFTATEAKQASDLLRLAELERKLEEESASAQNYHAELATLRSENDDLKHKCTHVEEVVHDLTEKLATAEREIISQLDTIDSLRATITERDALLQAQQNPSDDILSKLALAEREIENQMDLVDNLRTQLAERTSSQANEPSDELFDKLGVAEQEIQRQMETIDSLQHQLSERNAALIAREEAAETTQKELQDQLLQARSDIAAHLATVESLRSTLAAFEDTKPKVDVATAKSTSDADGWDAEFGDDFVVDSQPKSASQSTGNTAVELDEARGTIKRLEEVLSQREIELQQVQEQFNTLQQTHDAVREELQQRLFQMEQLETSNEERSAQFESEILDLKTALAAERDRQSHSNPDMSNTSRISELEADVSDLQAQLEVSRAAEVEASNLRSELEIIKQAAQESEIRFISEIEVLQDRLSQSSDSADLEAQIQDLSRKLHAKTDQLKESIATNEDYMGQIGALTKQVKQLNSQVQSQSSSLSQLEASLAEKERDLDALNEDLEANNQRIQELQAEVHSKTDMLGELEARSSRAVEELESQLEKTRQELMHVREELSQPNAAASLSAADVSEWETKLSEAESRRVADISALQQDLEEIRGTSRAEIDELMTQVQHLQQTNSQMSSELQARDAEITEKSSALRDVQERLRSMEERYKEQVIAADQFMGETGNLRKQIKKLTDNNEKLAQENGNMANQFNALQKDFDSAKHRIHELDEKLRERVGASDAQATELSAIATRLKAELISLQQQRDNEIMAKDQEMERIRIEKQEEYERLSMQIQDLFREREETNIRVESASAEVSRATTRSMNLQRELEAARTETAMTLRALQTEKDALEEALQSAQLKVTALEAESTTVNADLQGRVQELADSLTQAREERDRLEQTLLSLEKTFAEEKMSLERTSSDHVNKLLSLQRQNEDLSIRLAEETERSASAITNLTQRLEQLQAHSNSSHSDTSTIETLNQQIVDKDSLIQSLLKEKDELVQRLVVSTQDASSPVDRIVAAKEELEIQLFRMQESLRLAATENAALRERLQVETQRDQVNKLTTAVEILKREKEELTKQLNSIRSGTAETETVVALRAEKQQLSQLLFSKTMELEEVSRERAALLRRFASLREQPAATTAAADVLSQGGLPAGPAENPPTPTTDTTDSAASATMQGADEKGDPNQPGWVSGVWNVIWGTD
jgi:chromosome segregation ATPase